MFAFFGMEKFIMQKQLQQVSLLPEWIDTSGIGVSIVNKHNLAVDSVDE